MDRVGQVDLSEGLIDSVTVLAVFQEGPLEIGTGVASIRGGRRGDLRGAARDPVRLLELDRRPQGRDSRGPGRGEEDRQQNATGEGHGEHRRREEINT